MWLIRQFYTNFRLKRSTEAQVRNLLGQREQRDSEWSSWRIWGFNQTIINHTRLIINPRLECLHISGLSAQTKCLCSKKHVFRHRPAPHSCGSYTPSHLLECCSPRSCNLSRGRDNNQGSCFLMIPTLLAEAEPRESDRWLSVITVNLPHGPEGWGRQSSNRDGQIYSGMLFSRETRKLRL